MGLQAPRPNPEPGRAEPGSGRLRDAPLAAPAERRSRWRALRRRLASLILEIGWPATLIAVAAIAGGGIGIAVIEPNGLGRSRDASYVVGRYLDLRPGGNADPYLREGWSETREYGRATTGVRSDIIFSFDIAQERDLVLTLLARPLFAKEDDEFWVDVLFNGRAVARWSFQRASQAQDWHSATIERDNLRQPMPVHVTFVVGATQPSAGSGLEIEAVALRE